MHIYLIVAVIVGLIVLAVQALRYPGYYDELEHMFFPLVWGLGWPLIPLVLLWYLVFKAFSLIGSFFRSRG